MILLNVLIYTVILFSLQEVARRFRWLTWAALIIAPAILIPFWSTHYTDIGWFELAKVYSVWIGCSWIMICRFTHLKDKKWAPFILYLILIINIAEAMIKGTEVGLPGYLLAISAFLLNATLPTGQAITIDKKSGNENLSWNVSPSWIIGYTIWNWSFVYFYIPTHTAIHAAVLASAFIAGLINHKIWAQARFFTLALHLASAALLTPFLLKHMGMPKILDPTMGLILAIISCGWMVVHTLYELSKTNYFAIPKYLD